MNRIKFKLVVLVASGLVAWPSANAEVIKHQINAENLVVSVSDESWQPGDFENGLVVPATYLMADSVEIDGRTDEPAWSSTVETVVPLTFGSVNRAYLKALYTDQEVFISVRWADDDEDRQHHPWVWNPQQEKYLAGPQVEDSVLLSFEAGCEWAPSLLAGYVYDFDGWQWLAARTDPLGQAIDLIGSVQDSDRPLLNYTRYQSRMTQDTWNLKFTEHGNVNLNANWDQLERVYMLQPFVSTVYYRAVPDGRTPPPFVEELSPPLGTPYPEDEARAFPQFKPVRLTDGAGEVSAKGQWADGFWTVEFRRNLVTPAGSLNDVTFERLTQFSVHVFDHTERIDQGSESKRLFLRFLESDDSPVQTRVAVD